MNAIRILICCLVSSLWLSSAHADPQCGVSMSCAVKQPKRCEETLCFVNEAGKKQYEKANDCKVQNKCAYAVDSVKLEFTKIPKSDPTYGFYRNQVCIADKACSNKRQLENAVWLDNVVYDFITPLVREGGVGKRRKRHVKPILHSLA